jgi:hypothetical protein
MVMTVPSGKIFHVSSFVLVTLLGGCVPKAVPAAIHVLLSGSQMAVLFDDRAPKMTRPSSFYQ